MVSSATATTIKIAVPLMVKRRDAREFLDHDRKHGHETEEHRAPERDAIHDARKELRGVLARTDARNESAALLEIFRNLFRIERDRRIEIGEEEHQ